MKHDPDWRRSREAERLDAIGRLLRAQFDQIAKAPAPSLLIDLADRLETKARQSIAACDDDDDDDGAGPSPPKASDA
jgi:predicted metal-dependent hydrolase